MKSLVEVCKSLMGKFTSIHRPEDLLNDVKGPVLLHISDTPSEIYPFIFKIIDVLKPKYIIHTGDLAELKSPEEVIRVAKESGGKIFLAHPSYHYRNTFMPEEELKFWLELGIDGIECFSPYNGGRGDYYIDFCRKNNLMISGGSDCHGMFIPSRKLGVPEVSLEDLDIKKLL
jgi:hypothetical protein